MKKKLKTHKAVLTLRVIGAENKTQAHLQLMQLLREIFGTKDNPDQWVLFPRKSVQFVASKRK